jgi:enoyl-CoA hydratase
MTGDTTKGRRVADDLVLVDVEGGVALVTLNRPEARNALSGALIDELTAALQDCGRLDYVSVVVLTGADPAFCAGLDLGYLAERADRRSAGEDMFPEVPVPEIPKPIIGAINGPAVTGGLEVALACDFLVASDRARFADTHTRVGIVPGWGLTVALPAAVGLRRAKQMSATGNFVDAATALAWGLVNHVVPHDELLPFTMSLAADMVSVDQAALTSLMTTYDDAAELVDRPRRDLAWSRSMKWQDSADGAGAAIARRRDAVIERGRAQKG